MLFSIKKILRQKSLRLVIFLIATVTLTNGVKWSDQKDRDCLGHCNCDPHRTPEEPVCGGDGRTYGNNCSITCARCYLANASVTVVHDGPCKGKDQNEDEFRWWPEDKEDTDNDFEDYH